ncbi:MAG TPA: hypothetical protein VFJ05_03440, partial [Nitrososphaeraceae archaeon]|nr:hypothetical protein [Nitrososphaeraceae archaeon]
VTLCCLDLILMVDVINLINNLAKSFAKGQPFTRRIGSTLLRDQLLDSLKNIHSHSIKRD